MTTEDFQDKLTTAVDKARAGVDYSAQAGAQCPYCSTIRAKVTGSLPWDSGFKTRYHKCVNQDCALRKLDITIKSVQTDPVHQQVVGG